jgi:hypothetical protein
VSGANLAEAPAWSEDGPTDEVLDRASSIGERFFATFPEQLIDYVLEDYKSGELDLRGALSAIDSAAARPDVSPVRRAMILGTMAARALDAGEPAYLGRKKPARYPRWLREYAVDTVLDFQSWMRVPLLPPEGVPDDRQPLGSSILRTVTVVLAGLGIFPQLKPGDPSWDGSTPTSDFQTLQWRVLHRWYLERKRREGTSAHRGRPAQPK